MFPSPDVTEMCDYSQEPSFKLPRKIDIRAILSMQRRSYSATVHAQYFTCTSQSDKIVEIRWTVKMLKIYQASKRNNCRIKFQLQLQADCSCLANISVYKYSLTCQMSVK